MWNQFRRLKMNNAKSVKFYLSKTKSGSLFKSSLNTFLKVASKVACSLHANSMSIYCIWREVS